MLFTPLVQRLQYFNFNLSLQLITIFVLVPILIGCASNSLEKATELNRAGHFDEAIKTLEEGIKKDPDNAMLHANLTKTRTNVLNELLSEVNKARAAGNLDEADKLLQRAVAYDEGDKRVSALRQEINIERNQNQALQRAEDLVASQKNEAALHLVNESLKDNPHHAGLLEMRHKLEKLTRQAQINSAQMGLAETRPISLDFREANLRNVLDVMTRNSGVNFVLDKDIRPDVKVTTYLKSVRIEDAIDLITSTNQLTKKILDEKTILIYPNTPEKQHEYQEQVVKVFYISSGDVTGAATFLKSMLKIHDPFVDTRTNMMSIRESPETIQLAERLVELYDSSDAEVLLEVEIVEVDATKLTNLGVEFPSTLTLTPLSLSGQNGLTLASLKNLNDSRIGVSTPSLTLNLQKQVGDVNILANPSIRARNHEKAKILIGEKVPTISATSGVNGFVTDSVTYQDVGLKLDVEPDVFPDDEVAIKIALEVSTLGAQIQTSNGTTAYQISTRNASTALRLHDGETQLLAGLMNHQETSSSNRLPGLGDFPILGRLFRSQNDSSSRTELILSITPRILHNIRRPDVTETELWVGTEANQRMRASGGRPISSIPNQVDPKITDARVQQVVSPMPIAREQITDANTSGKQTINSIVQQGSAEQNKSQTDLAMLQAKGKSDTGNLPLPTTVSVGNLNASAPLDALNASAPGALSWTGPQEVHVGETIELKLQAQGASGVHTLPVNLQFPQNLFQIVSVEQAETAGVATGFSRQIDTQAGVVRMNTLYPAGLNGNASVVKIKLKAIQIGQAELSLTSNDVSAVESMSVSGMTLPPILKITIK